ncbi:hypothetical protein ES703_76311 [subsurface metagenome]
MPIYNPGAAVKLAYTEIIGSNTPALGADSWANWDLSSQVPEGATAVEVIIQRVNTPGQLGVRARGSALDRLISEQATHRNTFTVAVDNTRTIERYSATVAADSLFQCIGYWS